MTPPKFVHCLFEQSGTFKNAFARRGIPAADYDIRNDYGQTDCVIDLFDEIVRSYDGLSSIFDSFSSEELIFCFFPCIYFCESAARNQMYGPWNVSSKVSLSRLWEWKLNHARNRHHYYELALKLTAIVEMRGLRMIVENPWKQPTATNYFWFNRPSFIDWNRRRRGDYFVKPTAYWFINCLPTYGQSFSRPQKVLTVKGIHSNNKSGICSAPRSEISPVYADNFLSDFVFGFRVDGLQQMELF